MRTLYQFPLSHFCEKARWVLDHKELDYVAQNLTPVAHRAFAKLKTGQYQLPILQDGSRWVADSTAIAVYLDEVYPELPLLRSDPKQKQLTLELNDLANELGVHVRRWAMSFALTESEESLDIIIGEKGYLRKFEKYTKPLMKIVMEKGLKLDDERVEASKQRIDEIVQIFNQKLIENSGRYLVGNRLGLADIAVCSMLAPILSIEGTPWEKENTELLSEDFKNYKTDLASLPLGQYVLRIYQTERNARIDWRGV